MERVVCTCGSCGEARILCAFISSKDFLLLCRVPQQEIIRDFGDVDSTEVELPFAVWLVSHGCSYNSVNPLGVIDQKVHSSYCTKHLDVLSSQLVLHNYTTITKNICEKLCMSFGCLLVATPLH